MRKRASGRFGFTDQTACCTSASKLSDPARLLRTIYETERRTATASVKKSFISSGKYWTMHSELPQRAWLTDEYTLTPRRAAQVLGTSAEYSEVADGNDGIVLKINKGRLKGLRAAK